MGDTFSIIRSTEGLKGFRLGFLPTMIGYHLQGLGKYGFYEVFKDLYGKVVGPENAAKNKTLGYAISSACAEVIADVLLCPWEAVKIRI